MKAGDPLFDIRYEIAWAIKTDPTKKAGRSLHLSVVTTRDCYLKEIVAQPGEPITAGSKVGFVALGPDTEYNDFEHTSRLPVGMKMVKQ